MIKKWFYLIASVMALLVFIGFMTEKGPIDMFGYALNIWVYRLAWLLISISFFTRYFKLKKLGL